MDKYIVAFKYQGKIDFPDDADESEIQVPIILLPKLQQGEFEFLSINHIFPSERTEHSDYDPNGSDSWTILEVKMLLTNEEAAAPEKLLQKVIDDLSSQQLLMERVDEELLGDVMLQDANLTTDEKVELAEDIEVSDDKIISQTIVTFSHKDRNRHYLVELKYNDQLEAINQTASDGHIIHELIMLMQIGDSVEIVSFELTHNEEIDNICDDETATANTTEFHVRLQVNEFLLDLHDPEAVYYYVLGQLSHCEPEITYRYSCGEAPLVKTVVGIDLHCSIGALNSDDV